MRAHHFGGRAFCIGITSMSCIADLVDALDDLHDPVHVAGVIGNDDHVGGLVGGDVPVLRDQRPQHRHQLHGAHVLDGDTSVTISSEVELTCRAGRRRDLKRCSASGTIFMTLLPAGTAMKPWTCEDGQEGLVEACGVIGVEENMVTWARTRGSRMKVLWWPRRPPRRSA